MSSFSDNLSRKDFNQWSLSFRNKKLENKYAEFNKSETLTYIRAVILTSVFFYAVFAILDAYLVPQLKLYFWFIRFILVIPFALLICIISNFRIFQKYMFIFLSFLSFFAGLGIIAMIAISPPPVNSFYYAGLILVLLYNYNFLKLPFLWASITGFLLIIIYELTIFHLHPLPDNHIVNNTFFLLSANFFCMFSSYLIEYNNRKNFFLKHSLNEKNKEINLLNENLENEVKKQTEEIKKTYDKLCSSEKYHRHILENLGEGVAIVDLSENITFANSAAERIFGTEKGKLVGRNLIEFTTSRSLDIIQSESEKINSGSSAQYEIEIINEAGKIIYLAVTARPEYNDSGELKGILGIYRDITKRKKIEDEMKLRLDYESLLSSISHRFFGVYDLSASVMETLAEFGKFIKASHVFLYEIDQEHKTLKKSYNWFDTSNKTDFSEFSELDLKDLQNLLVKLDQNQIIDIYKEENPAVLAENRILHENLITNSILIPVRANNKLRAITGFCYETDSCLWSDKYLALVTVLADIFGYAYERKNYELQIQDQLNEKESLLKEIHHRVKNNMQIITSIIRLQTRFLNNIDIDDILLNFQNRMQTMTQAYNKVFMSGSFTKINFERYLSSLIIDLYYSHNISNKKVEIVTDIDKVELDINIVIPLGLIINEIITNSLKHAFQDIPETEQGKISVKFKQLENEEFHLVITDNGIGVPENFTLVQANTLGALLIHILSDQIKAKVKIEKNNGTVFTLNFNNLVLKTFTEF
jgi:PAS domain S-box-containing protein